MQDQQARRVNEAAEKFAEAIKESYQALADRSVSAQELNAQLTRDFVNNGINNLRTQAESNRALAEDLIEQQREQQEASQKLTQESVNAYMDFLNSMFSYSRQGSQTAKQATREVETIPPRPGPEVPPRESVRPGTTPGDVLRETSPDTPIAPPEEVIPPDVASPPGEEGPPREEPPPGEERPERRGAAPTTPPTPREQPPAGEERPRRRTP